MKSQVTAQKSNGRKSKAAVATARSCGLCGKTSKLTKTLCCGKYICDDEAKYELFSYARNSCDRNHRQYTLCSYHHAEEHTGEWKACDECMKAFETEMYVWYGTNEYNFEKLEKPPSFKPTLCASCQSRIKLGEGGYMIKPGGDYLCDSCHEVPMP
jgi:hypothetical protein